MIPSLDDAALVYAHANGNTRVATSMYNPVDLPAVLEAAAQHEVVVEINAHPQRIDADGDTARMARDKGALLCISPDAHAVAGLADLSYGIGAAHRGWLEPEHVLNTRSADEVEAHLQRRRKARGESPS